MPSLIRQIIVLLSVTLCLFAPALAEAQTPLTLEQVVALALKRAPEAAAARQHIAAARARVGQARAAYWPGAGVEVKYLARWPKAELPIDLSGLQDALPPGTAPEIGDIDDVHHFSAGLRLGYRVFDVSRGPRVDAASHAQGAARAAARGTDAAMAYRARATFLGVLLARDLEVLARKSLAVAVKNLERVTIAERLGSSSRLAQAQARVRVAQLQARLSRAQSEHQRLRWRLASLLGLTSPPRLTGDLEQLAGVPGSSPGTSTNPAIDGLRLRRRAARALERSLSRGFWPTVSLMGQAEVAYPHAMKLEWGPQLSAGVNLEWRLFDGFLRSSRQQEQRAVSRGLRRQEQALSEKLSRRLTDLDARRRGARAELASAREVERQAGLQLSVARAASAAGAATHLDRQAAEVALDRARAGVSQTLASLCLIAAQQLQARGLTRAPGIDSAAPAESHGSSGGNR